MQPLKGSLELKPFQQANGIRKLCLSLPEVFPWTTGIIVLGLFLRLHHYLRNPSMWHDEAALVLNVFNKGFRELLGPLLFSQAAPPLFLWIERSVFLVLGEST